MGTSQSFLTPSGGQWSQAKSDITDFIGGNANITPSRIIGGTIRASGGLGPALPSSSLGSSGGGTSTGSTGGSRGGRISGRSAVGRAVSGLGAFGSGVLSQGLDATLSKLGLDELRGRSAAEVVSRIAEHLADKTPGLAGELLINTLRDAIFEVARTEDPTYENFAESLQTFLDREGIEGLIEAFLTHYVFDRVWLLIENHVDRRSDNTSDSTALASAVEGACRSHVQTLINDMKGEGNFNTIDWFGDDGQHLGQDIVSSLESSLAAL